jgi:hypothetical protein
MTKKHSFKATRPAVVADKVKAEISTKASEHTHHNPQAKQKILLDVPKKTHRILEKIAELEPTDLEGRRIKKSRHAVRLLCAAVEEKAKKLGIDTDAM